MTDLRAAHRPGRAQVGGEVSPNAESTMRLMRVMAASESIVNMFLVTAHDRRVAVSPNATLPPAPPLANTVWSAPGAESGDAEQPPLARRAAS